MKRKIFALFSLVLLAGGNAAYAGGNDNPVLFMLDAKAGRQVISSNDVRAFFKQSIQQASTDNGVETSPATVDYVADLLSKFSRADALYERTEEGLVVAGDESVDEG